MKIPPLDEAWKKEPAPTPADIDKWLEGLERGQATPDFLSRLLWAYRAMYQDHHAGPMQGYLDFGAS